MHVKRRIRVDRPSVSVTWLFLLFTGLLLKSGQSALAQSFPLPFKSGERAIYGAYYNWHFVWVHAGEVSFHCDTLSFRGKPSWNFWAAGKTFKAYDVFYTVRDTFCSVVSFPDFNPVWFRRVVHHGRAYSSHEYEFRAGEGTVLTKIHRDRQEPFADRLAYTPGIYDLLSSAYRFRSYDFDRMEPNQKVPFSMLIDNRSESLFFRYLGKEIVKTRNGRRFLCHKVSVWLLDGDFFPEGENMMVWFTADENRLPIMVETEIVVGSVKAILLDARQLKFPLTSEIMDKK